MKRMSLLVLVALSAASCNREAPPEPAEQDTSTSQPAIASSAAAPWVPLKAAEDASMLSAPCVARADAHATGQVSTTFVAQVAKVHVQVGDTLKAGDPVVEVFAPELVSAAAAYLGGSSRLKVHRQRLAALQTLRKEGMVRSAAVFEQEALVAELSSDMRQAAAVLRMAKLSPKAASRIAASSRITLVAPVDGVVASISGHPGEVLDGSKAFAQIIAPSQARIEVTSPVALTIGATLSMLTADGQRHALKTTPVSSVIAPETGMHRTWFALQDDSVQLGDGLRCTIEWTLADDVWQAPAGAVATTSEGSMVWRRRAGKVERVRVQVLRSSGASVLLQGALAAGDALSADGSMERGTP